AIIEIRHLRQPSPKLIAQFLEGVQRPARIAQLQDFIFDQLKNAWRCALFHLLPRNAPLDLLAQCLAARAILRAGLEVTKALFLSKLLQLPATRFESRINASGD